MTPAANKHDACSPSRSCPFRTPPACLPSSLPAQTCRTRWRSRRCRRSRTAQTSPRRSSPSFRSSTSSLAGSYTRCRAAESFLELYTATNPLVSGFAFSVFLGAVFLVVSEYNKNYSQVDRCWSLLPTFYVAHFNFWARLAGIPSQRLDAALLFGTVWSVSRPQTAEPRRARPPLT